MNLWEWEEHGFSSAWKWLSRRVFQWGKEYCSAPLEETNLGSMWSMCFFATRKLNARARKLRKPAQDLVYFWSLIFIKFFIAYNVLEGVFFI